MTVSMDIRQQVASFSRLPQDIHDQVALFLSTSDLLSISLTCRNMEGYYYRAISSQVTLKGPNQALFFIDACLADENVELGQTCLYGHPLAHSPKSPDKQYYESRSSKIRQLEFYEPGPRKIDFYEACHKIEFQIQSHKELNGQISGGLIGTAIRMCPNLTSLHIHQSSLPLNPALSLCIATWLPLLTSFHFHSSYTDATSLAFIIQQNSHHLQELDVSGVKSCQCNCDNGSKGARNLANALKRCNKVKKLIFRTSRTASIDDGLLFRLLAESNSTSATGNKFGTFTNDTFNYDEDKVLPCLTSLELHRLATPSSALIKFLTSSVSSNITHLFLGGLKKLRASHLINALKYLNKDTPCFFNSSSLLDLEIDFRLLSDELLEKIGCRISHLRLYQLESNHHLLKAIRTGKLPNLSVLIILQANQDSLFSPQSKEKCRLYEASQTHLPNLEIRWSDEKWLSVQQEKAM